MRISDWSSDVCSSDLLLHCGIRHISAEPEVPLGGFPQTTLFLVRQIAPAVDAVTLHLFIQGAARQAEPLHGLPHIALAVAECRLDATLLEGGDTRRQADRKSTRLNSSR